MGVGMVVATSGMFWLSRLGAGSTYPSGVLGPEIVMGLGLGLVFLAVPTIALGRTDVRDAGVASALINAVQQVGGALGPALLNTLYLSTGSTDLAGYRVTFLAAGVLFTLALLVTVLVVGIRRSTGSTTAWTARS